MAREYSTCSAGGVPKEACPLSVEHAEAWLLEMGPYGAVNCSAIVSGYVGYGLRHRYVGLLELCLKAVFYTVGVTLVFLVASPSSVGIKDLLLAPLAPVRDTYWYLSSYLCLFFFMPWLDSLVAGADWAQARRLLIALFVTLPLLPTLFYADIVSTKAGYSTLWLGAMYVVGACMRRWEGSDVWAWGRSGAGAVSLRSQATVGGQSPRRSHDRMGTLPSPLLVYGLSVLAAWVAWTALAAVTVRLFGAPKKSGMVIAYTSPLVVASSVALVMFFVPLCFGVYLLHVEPLVWDHVIGGAFAGYAFAGPLLLPGLVLGTAAGIWLVGSLVDWVRLRLFLLLRVRAWCERLGGRLDAWLNPGFSAGGGE